MLDDLDATAFEDAPLDGKSGSMEYRTSFARSLRRVLCISSKAQNALQGPPAGCLHYAPCL